MPYHGAIYDRATPVASYWAETVSVPPDLAPALEGDEACDVAVIGAGFTGLSTALHLARDHATDVRVLEAGPLGWGASGRNAGFCCLYASKLSLAQLQRRYGLAETKRFLQSQLEGIELVATLASEEGIACDMTARGLLTVAHRPQAAAALREEGEVLGRLAGVETEWLDTDRFAEEGFAGPAQHGALRVHAGFGLNPLKLLVGLARAASRHGAALHAASEVRAWERTAGRHWLSTAGGRLRAERVVVAGNGYMRDGLHPGLDGVALPAISNIVVTRPLTEEELARHRWRTAAPICDSRHLLNYFRLLADRRLLFGARGDTSGHPRAGQRLRSRLIAQMHRAFPRWRDVQVTHFWRGLVCATRRRTPCVGRLEDEPSVWFGFGYHGNGVNTAPWAGMSLARALASGADPARTLPAVVAGLAPRFPCARSRIWALRAAYAYYRVRDGA